MHKSSRTMKSTIQENVGIGYSSLRAVNRGDCNQPDVARTRGASHEREAPWMRRQSRMGASLYPPCRLQRSSLRTAASLYRHLVGSIPFPRSVLVCHCSRPISVMGNQVSTSAVYQFPSASQLLILGLVSHCHGMAPTF